MKEITQKKITTNIFIALGIICSVLLFSSCAKKMSFNKSSVVPGAEGKVKVKTDKNNNYTIDLSVENLAMPGDLTPSRKAYVVWMETESNGTKNIGNVNPSGGLFSGKLKGSLKTVTPFKPITFYITAEDDETVTYPMGQEVLRTK